ncbi:MAG: DUF4287 domain-containing protein [Thermoanaerobaculia bacterium]
MAAFVFVSHPPRPERAPFVRSISTSTARSSPGSRVQHGLTHGYANLIAHEALGSAAAHSEADDLVAGQYAGKETLRPIYDRIATAVRTSATTSSWRRRRATSACAGPSSSVSSSLRQDAGGRRAVAQGAEPTGRLEASGSFNAMVSHRVRVTDPADVDAELVGWLRRAYDAAG